MIIKTEPKCQNKSVVGKGIRDNLNAILQSVAHLLSLMQTGYRRVPQKMENNYALRGGGPCLLLGFFDLENRRFGSKNTVLSPF